MSKPNNLEAESIEIIREAVATARKPVMMYSIGKDSSVMLHLARKAFYPAPPPFPLLHVDTGWKFKAMYAHRERMVTEAGMQLITHTNPEGQAAGVGPFTHGSNYHTDVMKTQALKQVLDAQGFDVVFGGARRDEDGYYWITGRMDDVINVSGHRLGTAEIESAINEHEAVADRSRGVGPHVALDPAQPHPGC